MMQQILVRILGPALIGIGLQIIAFSIFKAQDKEYEKNRTAEHLTIRLPKAYIWVGCLCTLFCAICLFLMNYFPNGTASTYTQVFFGLFGLGGVAMTFGAIVWKIDIYRSEDYFIYRTVFCKTYKIKYIDCIYYELNDNYLIIKTEKKKLHIDRMAINVDFLWQMLNTHKTGKRKRH